MTQQISGAHGAADAPAGGGDTGSTHLIVASRLPEHGPLHATNTPPQDGRPQKTPELYSM